MEFLELIPASNKLAEELLEIRGGFTSGVFCDTGTICSSGLDDSESLPDPEA